jgi:hypothetical protein
MEERDQAWAFQADDIRQKKSRRAWPRCGPAMAWTATPSSPRWTPNWRMRPAAIDVDRTSRILDPDV